MIGACFFVERPFFTRCTLLHQVWIRPPTMVIRIWDRLEARHLLRLNAALIYSFIR